VWHQSQRKVIELHRGRELLVVPEKNKRKRWANDFHDIQAEVQNPRPLASTTTNYTYLLRKNAGDESEKNNVGKLVHDWFDLFVSI
jgi:hypothetical protein